jgi:purine-binding chemotaxis protein CheW
MDFLSIRKKARERAEAKESGAPAPEASAQAEATAAPEAPPAPAAQGPVSPPAPPAPQADAAPSPQQDVNRRKRRGTDTVLTEEDLLEGALQARFQGLAPSADGRFATWRPGAGPPPVEPDPDTYAALDAGGRPDDGPPPPRPEAVPSAASIVAAPADPLDAFFYRPDEEAAIVPALGAGAVEEPALPRQVQLDEFLTFRLGNEEFAVAIERVREVLRAPGITEVPRAPAGVLGVVTVRGEVVPVVDARARLGVAGGDETGGRIVIVDSGDGPIGVLVDAVSGVVRLPRGAIEPCPQGISAAASDCVTGIGRWRDRLFMVVDAGALLKRGRPAEVK